MTDTTQEQDAAESAEGGYPRRVGAFDFDAFAVEEPGAVFLEIQQSGAFREDGVVAVTKMADLLATTKRRDVVSSSGVTSGPDNESILGNERPLIPLQIDGPEHTKFRKLLDPLFAPTSRRAPRAARRRRGQRADRPVHRPARDRVLRGVLRAAAVAHLPRAHGPARRHDRRLPRIQGRRDPPAGRVARRAEGVSAPGHRAHERLPERRVRSPPRRRRAGRRPDRRLPVGRDRRRPTQPRGDPRHRVPAADRGARHGVVGAVEHGGVPRPSSRATSAAGRRPHHAARRDRGAAAHAHAGAVRRPLRHLRLRRERQGREGRRHDRGAVGGRQRRSRDVPRPVDRRLQPSGQPTRRLCGRVPPLSGIAPRTVWSCAPRSVHGTNACPSTRSLRARSPSSTTTASAS